MQLFDKRGIMSKESNFEKYGLILIGIMGLVGGSVKAYEFFLCTRQIS